nr:reverse transcriptase domain-containing protein [Tanacetum cinerariifolium]
MLERSTGIARVTKAISGPEAITKEQQSPQEVRSSSPLRRRLIHNQYFEHRDNFDPEDQGPQLKEGKNLNTEAPETRRTPSGRTSAPIGQVQIGSSMEGQAELGRRTLRQSSKKSGLCQCGAEELLQQKRYDKDPTKIHGIKRKPNEGLQVFMDRFKAESAHIKGVPLVLRIFMFIHGHGHPELAKKLNDKIPKTINEMEIGLSGERYQAKCPKEQGLSQKKIRSSAWVRRIYVYGSSSLEIMYERCFRNLNYRTRSRLKESRIPLVRFLGEFNYPLGVIDLKVTMGEYGRTQTVIMKFAVVKSPSPYNALLGRMGIISLGVVAFTIHSMIKILTSNGIATVATTKDSERVQTNRGSSSPKSVCTCNRS